MKLGTFATTVLKQHNYGHIWSFVWNSQGIVVQRAVFCSWRARFGKFVGYSAVIPILKAAWMAYIFIATRTMKTHLQRSPCKHIKHAQIKVEGSKRKHMQTQNAWTHGCHPSSPLRGLLITVGLLA